MRLAASGLQRATPEEASLSTSLPVVRARAPLRLGLAGGGTDLSPYCDDYGGAVLNVTIDRYAYAFIGPSADGRVHFRSEDLDLLESFPCDADGCPGASLGLHAGVYRRMVGQFNGGVPLPVTVTTATDAPPGSGLGTSSALVVALVEAYRTLLGLPLGLYDVAHLAWEIERKDLALAGGKQDQYAAAFGGANFIEFLAGDRVIVNPLRVPVPVMNELESSLVTCFTGVSRSSGKIIEEQQTRMVEAATDALEGLHQLKRDAIDMKLELLRGDVTGMGAILNRSWLAKKRTAGGISSALIEDILAAAERLGALAGKVSGAGGGGFMMFLVPPERRAGFIRDMRKLGHDAGPVNFTSVGIESWRAM
jgi:D-glycero-alpha-D-manno-heptose-7-phosphate kinase